MNKANENISPFHGRPPTRQHVDKDGTLSFSISPRELTPFRAIIADNLAMICTMVAGIKGFLTVPELPEPHDWLYWGVIGLTLLSIPVFRFVFRWLFRKRWKMVVTPDQFKIFTWLGWRSYDRMLPHKFSLLEHDKTQLERERIELLIRQGRGNGRTYSQLKYYGNSFHISFEYLGQRNDIATVFTQKHAVALVARLKACDDVMDAQSKMGDGTALDPDDQWDDQPGDIEY